MYTLFEHGFAYAIKQTSYAFFAKIILCMYILYGDILKNSIKFPAFVIVTRKL